MTLKSYIYTLLLCGVFITFIGCKQERYSVSRVDAATVTVDRNIKEDSSVTAFIAPYKERVDKEMDSPLAFAPVSISKKDSKYNTAIGNMMADAVFELANPAFESRAGYPFHAVPVSYTHLTLPTILRV